MWSIARHHGVSLNKLMRQNHLGPKDTLDVGRKLQIPGAATTRKVVRKVHYKVRKGDSLARIAGKFNVSIKEIANWNNLDAKRYLQPGQGLLLYVNVVGG
jgi:membrane-bound lytic murein transglycosylase D